MRVRAPRAMPEPEPRENVSDSHPVIAGTAQALRRAKADGDGLVELRGGGMLPVTVGAGSIERVIFILDRLVRALEPRNIACLLGGKEAIARRGVDEIKFRITEKIAFPLHSPTIEEMKAEERRRRNGGTDSDYYWSKAYRQFDRIPTGELTLSITSWGSYGKRRNWRDTTRARLETQIDTAAEIFEEWIEDTRKERIERARQSRLRERAAENRRLAEARDERETARDELVTEIVDLAAKAGHLRTWIEWADSSEDPDTKRMVDWSRQRLAAIERALNPETFGDWLREQKLFPEVDPLAPLPKDPDL